MRKEGFGEMQRRSKGSKIEVMLACAVNKKVETIGVGCEERSSGLVSMVRSGDG